MALIFDTCEAGIKPGRHQKEAAGVIASRLCFPGETAFCPGEYRAQEGSDRRRQGEICAFKHMYNIQGASHVAQ